MVSLKTLQDLFVALASLMALSFLCAAVSFYYLGSGEGILSRVSFSDTADPVTREFLISLGVADRKRGELFIMSSLAFSLIATVILEILVYKLWKLTQDKWMPQGPFSAIAMQFIPLAHFIGVFRTFSGLASNLNRFCKRNGVNAEMVSVGLARFSSFWLACLFAPALGATGLTFAIMVLNANLSPGSSAMFWAMVWTLPGSVCLLLLIFQFNRTAAAIIRAPR
jgi:hypothetical protein